VKINLRQVALQSKNAEYNPKRFSGVIMRISNPKSTALIFKTGKIVCTGTNSVDSSKTAAKKYAKIIKKIGYPVRFTNFRIQNIVGSCDVKFQVSLNKIQNGNDALSTYNPETFPGLIYRMPEPKLTLLLFKSGKLVFIGAKDKEQAETLVSIGDAIVFHTDFEECLNDLVMGKALDNRVGCAIMTKVMQQLDTEATVYGVGTVQEEVGLKGAKTSAFKLNPDMAIALDVTIAGDHPGVKPEDAPVKAGSGPVISFADASVSLTIDSHLLRYFHIFIIIISMF